MIGKQGRSGTVGKYKSDFKSDDIYKFYVKKCKNKGVVPLSKKLVNELQKEVYSFIVDIVVRDGADIYFPGRMGSFRIRKKKSKIILDENGDAFTYSLPMDYGKTRALWTELYKGKTWDEILQIPDKPTVVNLNEHTNKYRFKWFWDKTASLLPNMSVYSLDMCRTIDRNAAKIWKSTPGLENLYYI